MTSPELRDALEGLLVASDPSAPDSAPPGKYGPMCLAFARAALELIAASEGHGTDLLAPSSPGPGLELLAEVAHGRKLVGEEVHEDLTGRFGVIEQIPHEGWALVICVEDDGDPRQVQCVPILFKGEWNAPWPRPLLLARNKLNIATFAEAAYQKQRVGHRRRSDP